MGSIQSVIQNDSLQSHDIFWGKKSDIIILPASYEGGAATSNGSHDRSSDTSPECPALWRFPEIRLLFERSWRTTSAQATRQIQLRPITITPTSTVSSLPAIESSTEKLKKYVLKDEIKRSSYKLEENALRSSFFRWCEGKIKKQFLFLSSFLMLLLLTTFGHGSVE